MRHQLDDQSCRASLLSLSPVSRSDPPSSVWRLPVALLHLGSSTATPSCWCVCSSSPYPPSCERRPCTTAVALLATNTTTLSARHLSEELLSQNFPQKRETKRKKKTLHRRCRRRTKKKKMTKKMMKVKRTPAANPSTSQNNQTLSSLRSLSCTSKHPSLARMPTTCAYD